MIPDWLKQNLELLVKPSVPFLFVLIGAVSLVIWSPFGLRHSLGMETFYLANSFWFGCVVLYSAGYLAYYSVEFLALKVKTRLDRRNFEKQMIRKIQCLPPKETELLNYLLDRDVDVSWIPCNNSALHSLLQKGILYFVISHSDLRGQTFNCTQCFACMIQPECLTILRNQSDLLPPVYLPKEEKDEFDLYQFHRI